MRPHVPMPFIRIGGRASHRPPLVAKIQADASFNLNRPLDSMAAYILRTASGRATYRDTVQLGRVLNSTEAEWAGVAAAVEVAINMNEMAVELENDNLSVIHQLMLDTWPRHKYARYYHRKIRDNAAQMEWLAVRWIPREVNAADLLLR